MESTCWFEFAKRKIRTTYCIADCCKGTYGDVVLILSAVLSSMASECWPGTGFDRKRFIQLLVDSTPNTKAISIPRLGSYLNKKTPSSQEPLLSHCYPPDAKYGRILLGPDVDQDEETVIALLGDTVSLAEIRKHSYAALLYKDVRSNYVHEYRIGIEADNRKMTGSEKPIVSYVNMGEEFDRLIHFPLDLIASIVLECACYVDSLQGSVAKETTTWWIDEKTT